MYFVELAHVLLNVGCQCHPVWMVISIDMKTMLPLDGRNCQLYFASKTINDGFLNIIIQPQIK